jgi:hypothetical protein
VDRAAPPGDSSEYCGLAPLKGVRSVFGGDSALRLFRFVDSGGGGPRRLARSDVLDRLDKERCRGSSIVMSSSMKELRDWAEARRGHDAAPSGRRFESQRPGRQLLSTQYQLVLSHMLAHPRRTRKSGGGPGASGQFAQCGDPRRGAVFACFEGGGRDCEPVEALDDRSNGCPKIDAAARQRALRSVLLRSRRLGCRRNKDGTTARAGGSPIRVYTNCDVRPESERKSAKGLSQQRFECALSQSWTARACR